MGVSGKSRDIKPCLRKTTPCIGLIACEPTKKVSCKELQAPGQLPNPVKADILPNLAIQNRPKFLP